MFAIRLRLFSQCNVIQYKILKYEIINIKSEKKNGKIKIKNKENQLILTTCDQIKKGNQLIIEANLKIDNNYQCIRFANEGQMWNQDIGANYIGNTTVINKAEENENKVENNIITNI